jgi:uncharacterized protein (TIGR04255 family)
MPFPEHDRVEYETNVLVGVMAQAYFPALLEIKQNIPEAFQIMVRKNFPLFEEFDTKELEVSEDQNDFKENKGKVYTFENEQQDTKIILSHEYISVVTQNYVNWKSFKPSIAFALNCLCESYEIPFYTRVGLRYKNVVRPSIFGLTPEEMKWEDYIVPALSGCFGDKDILGDIIEDYSANLLIDLKDNISKLNVTYGLVEKFDESETGFLLDNDFFTTSETKGNENAINQLDEYNRRSHDFFRWAIKPSLHEAMVAKK